MGEAFVVEGPPDRPDAAVHHVGGRDHIGAGFGLDERLEDQLLDSGVVDDLIALEQPVMSVAGVGIEGHVGDDAELRDGGLDRPCRGADEIVWVERFRPGRVAKPRVGVGKQRNGGDAKVGGATCRIDRNVDRQPVDAGHRWDRLAHGVAGDDEDRPDQVVDRERRFAHQPSRPVGFPVASHAASAEDAVHVRPRCRIRGKGRSFAGHGTNL